MPCARPPKYLVLLRWPLSKVPPPLRFVRPDRLRPTSRTGSGLGESDRFRRMLACLRRPPLLARCPLTLRLWLRADRNPATLPDDSASVLALQSIDRARRSSQPIGQLLSRCSSVVLSLSQASRARHLTKNLRFLAGGGNSRFVPI